MFFSKRPNLKNVAPVPARARFSLIWATLGNTYNLSKNNEITSKILPKSFKKCVRKLSKNTSETHLQKYSKEKISKNGVPVGGEELLNGSFFGTGAPLEPQGPPKPPKAVPRAS